MRESSPSFDIALRYRKLSIGNLAKGILLEVWACEHASFRARNQSVKASRELGFWRSRLSIRRSKYLRVISCLFISFSFSFFFFSFFGDSLTSYSAGFGRDPSFHDHPAIAWKIPHYDTLCIYNNTTLANEQRLSSFSPFVSLLPTFLLFVRYRLVTFFRYLPYLPFYNSSLTINTHLPFSR